MKGKEDKDRWRKGKDGEGGRRIKRKKWKEEGGRN